MVFKKSDADILRDTKKGQNLIKERNHLYISGEYTNR